MDDKNIKLFENKRIRTAWNEEEQEWYLSVIDVCAVLSGSDNPRRYWSDLKRKLKFEGSELYEKIVQLKMEAPDGKMRETDAANTEQILRIIQSIPSPKAEPFKMWLAQVGAERIDETIDPELAIDRALTTYLKKGYDKDWIHQRILTIRVRNELTDEWENRGVSPGGEYAILTNEITKAWSDMSVRQYKKLKGLTKENLRDNMSTLELVLNMLAETTTTEISKKQKPKTFTENVDVARQGSPNTCAAEFLLAMFVASTNIICYHYIGKAITYSHATSQSTPFETVSLSLSIYTPDIHIGGNNERPASCTHP